VDMQDTTNLKKKVGEYSKKIEQLKNENASLSEVNYWRRQLNIVFQRIREREKNQRKNAKQFKKANRQK
jgi:regulator of replication initiation timing